MDFETPEAESGLAVDGQQPRGFRCFFLGFRV